MIPLLMVLLMSDPLPADLPDGPLQDAVHELHGHVKVQDYPDGRGYAVNLYTTEITASQLAALPELPNIVELDIGGTSLNDSDFLPLTACKRLKKLKICYNNISGLIFTKLHGLGKLQEIVIYCSQIDDKYVPAILETPGLRSLNLSLTPISDAAFRRIPKGAALEALELELCPNLTYRCLRDIGDIRSLRELRLKHFKIDDTHADVFAKLKNIRLLDLSYTKIGDESVKAISKLATLEKLNLSNTDITFGSAANLGSLKRLKVLDLTDTWTADADVIAIASIGTLEELNLCNTFITDSSMAALAKCNKLKLLNISKTNITDKGFAKVAEAPHLERLRIGPPLIRWDYDRILISHDCEEEVYKKRPKLKVQHPPFEHFPRWPDS